MTQNKCRFSQCISSHKISGQMHPWFSSIAINLKSINDLKCADWIIDIGPGGGKHGGSILFEGTPEEMVVSKESSTGIFLKEKLNVTL